MIGGFLIPSGRTNLGKKKSRSSSSSRTRSKSSRSSSKRSKRRFSKSKFKKTNKKSKQRGGGDCVSYGFDGHRDGFAMAQLK